MAKIPANTVVPKAMKLALFVLLVVVAEYVVLERLVLFETMLDKLAETVMVLL